MFLFINYGFKVFKDVGGQVAVWKLQPLLCYEFKRLLVTVNSIDILVPILTTGDNRYRQRQNGGNQIRTKYYIL